MLDAYFAVWSNTVILSPLPPSPRDGERQRLEMHTKQHFSVGLPLGLSPGLPRPTSSRGRKLSMGSVGEENFLLLVTSPFPSCGGLKDVLGAGNNIQMFTN